MLKIFILGILVATIFYSYKSFKIYQDNLKEYAAKITPRLYSINNPRAITVTKEPLPIKKPKENENELIDNDHYEYIPEMFQLDDTEKLRSLGLSCMPEQFGYSKDEGERKFPHYGYPKCSAVNNQNYSYMHIDRESNILYMDCPDGNKGKYLAGPVDKRKFVYNEEVALK